MHLRSGLLFASFVLPAAPWALDVIVVDDDAGSGADTDSIAAAVTSAQEGDVVLVRDGLYSGPVTIAGKSVSVVADAGASVRQSGTITVTGLAAQQSVLLAGFESGPGSEGGAALAVSGCAGPVVADGMRLASPFFLNITKEMVSVEDSDAVVLNRCEIEAGLFFGPSGAGIGAVDSSVHLYDSAVVGGGHYPPGHVAAGGAGVDLDGGALFSLGSTIEGGQGTDLSDGPFGCEGVSGNGGAGIILTGADPVADLYDTQLLGGPPGEVGTKGPCTQGLPGAPSIVWAGVVNDVPWAATHFSVTSPVRDGDPVGVSLAGQPGDLVWVAFSTSNTLAPFPGIVGPLWVGAPAVFPAGALGAAGQLAFDVPTFLSPGAEGLVYASQALFVDTLGNATLSQPAPLVELDASL